jgi:hypothetical protein
MSWSKDQMWEVMNYCVCLHDMIIENERKYPSERTSYTIWEGPLAQPNHEVSALWAAFIAMRQEIRDSTMIWWSTYGGFEATPTSFHLICLKTYQIICLFYWTVTFICKNKPNIGKLYQIRRTITFICKNKPKMPISGRLIVWRSPRQSFVQSGAIYRRIWPWGAPTAEDALKVMCPIYPQKPQKILGVDCLTCALPIWASRRKRCQLSKQ